MVCSHVEQMQQLCIMVSCPEPGGIAAVLQHVCKLLLHPLHTQACCRGQPMLGTREGCHGKTILPSIPGDAPWHGRLGCRKGVFFNHVIAVEPRRP